MYIFVRWTGTYNFLMHQASVFKLKFYRLWCTKCNLFYSRGPLSWTRFIPMAKHESERTYICMDKTRISKKTFLVPLGFGGYLGACTIPQLHFTWRKSIRIKEKRFVFVFSFFKSKNENRKTNRILVGTFRVQLEVELLLFEHCTLVPDEVAHSRPDWKHIFVWPGVHVNCI